MREDINNEGVVPEKLYPGHLWHPGNNNAIVKVSRFNLINIPRINELLGTNFQGAILDFDECCAPNNGESLIENTKHAIETIKQGIRIGILSNMKAGARYLPFIKAVKEATSYEIKVTLTHPAKPDPKSFLGALHSLHLKEDEQALMIGDNHITDGGCISAGIPLVRVDPIQTKEPWVQTVRRSPQTGSRWFYSRLSDFYDIALKRKVLKDADFESDKKLLLSEAGSP